ncbi:hypothetical protein J6590_057320 [Homalodisca vitripennis]|nr:hypothetical protein J6590_057320 [Homalodisca vitripennis]
MKSSRICLVVEEGEGCGRCVLTSWALEMQTAHLTLESPLSLRGKPARTLRVGHPHYTDVAQR